MEQATHTTLIPDNIKTTQTHLFIVCIHLATSIGDYMLAAEVETLGRRMFQRNNSIFRVSNWLPTCRRYRYTPLASAAPASSRPSQNTW